MLFPFTAYKPVKAEITAVEELPHDYVAGTVSLCEPFKVGRIERFTTSYKFCTNQFKPKMEDIVWATLVGPYSIEIMPLDLFNPADEVIP